MTKIKFCGLFRPDDIEYANELKPDYVGFVFAKRSRRSVTPELAELLKGMLNRGIETVGVFVDEPLENVASLLNSGVIDIAQLHGSEDEDYIRFLQKLTGKPVIKAFVIKREDGFAALEEAIKSPADYILLDGGLGAGKAFDWELIKGVDRPFFLAGGLTPENVATALEQLSPYALDVSSGIETEGIKDRAKMQAFMAAARRS
ncbi:MAG: phosphoribosylanthranilate isomerase [Lachnospiraceae bacterium]|nr:phosphoribosylanthranilate isomerase [Lachnospiraceae bacterium]